MKTRSDNLLVYLRENEDKKRVQKNKKYKFSMNFQYAYINAFEQVYFTNFYERILSRKNAFRE